MVCDSLIYCYGVGDSTLFVISLSSSQTVAKYQFASQINDIYIEQQDCYIASANYIIMISGKDIVPIVEFDKELTSLTGGFDDSFFCSTEDGIYYFDSKVIKYKVLSCSSPDIRIIGDSLYILLEDNSLFRINKISKFKDVFLLLPKENVIIYNFIRCQLVK